MTNIQKRRMAMMGAVKRGRLPSGFQECEWVGNTTNYQAYYPYIDSGVKASNDLSLEITLSYLNEAGTANPYAIPFGVPKFRLRNGNHGNYTFYFGIQSKSVSISIPQNAPFTLYVDKNNVKYNGTTLGSWSSEAAFTSAKTMPVNATYDTSTTTVSGFYSRSSKGIYGCKMWINEELVRDFVPCYRKSDDVIGFYDICESICPQTNSPFYINVGTGNFAKGDDVK